MTLFLGTHQNRLDAKGRVSIPASFRLCLKEKQKNNDITLILRPSSSLPCIEGWPVSVFNECTASLIRNQDSTGGIFSRKQNDIATILYAQAWSVDPDREGRILLPDFLKAHANLENQASFLGLGTLFQIWEPVAAQNHYKMICQNTDLALLTDDSQPLSSRYPLMPKD